MRHQRMLPFLAAACLTALLSLPARAGVTEAHQLGFKVGSSKVDTLYNNNAGACARIKDVLEANPGTRISISSFSSPDGKTTRNRQLARQRAESAKETLLALIPGLDASQIVINKTEEDWTGVKKYLQRSKKEWKEEALRILDATEGDKKALLQDLWVGEAWEDLMKNCFPALRRVTIQLIEAPAASGNAAEDALLHFGNASSSIRKGFLDNDNGLKNLQQLAISGAPDLYIHVKSSPEGNEASNERLGLKRGQSIENQLKKLGYTGQTHVIYDGEDWEGLAKAVEGATDLPDKQAVLDILSDTTLSRNSRKKALQGLSYGKTWLRLLDVEMGGLRSAVITDSAR